MVKKLKDKGDKMIDTFYNKIVYKGDEGHKEDADKFYKTVLLHKGPN